MTIKTYIDYITYSPEKQTSATGLADALAPLGTVGSHDEVTRWLVESHYGPAELWGEVKNSVDLDQGSFVIDDTIIEKPHSDEAHSALVKWYHGSDGHVKGISLVQMLWVHGERVVPVDYRIVMKNGGVTKNEVAREMLSTAHRRGFRAVTVLFDSWYAANDTLRLVAKLGYYYVTRLKKNRRVIVNGVNVCIAAAASKHARVVAVPSVGNAKALVTGNDVYVATNNLSLARKGIIRRYARRWRVEEFFRAAKQVYRLAGCQARRSAAWATHVYAAILAYARHSLAGVDHYEVKRLAYQKMLGGYLSA